MPSVFLLNYATRASDEVVGSFQSQMNGQKENTRFAIYKKIVAALPVVYSSVEEKLCSVRGALDSIYKYAVHSGLD